MSGFVALNWILLLATASALALVFLRSRALMIKPSIVLLCLFHVQVQWAATALSGSIWSYLPRPLDFMLIVHGFPLVGLAGSVWFFRRSASATWDRVTRSEAVPNTAALVLLYTAVLGVAAWYLCFVGVQNTGLYYILVKPELSAMAREASLKLLPSTPLRYGFSFLQSVLAPLSAVLLALRAARRRSICGVLIDAGLLLLLLVIVTLPGARAPAAKIVLDILLAHFLMRRLRARPSRVLLAFLGVMFIPVLLSLLREGRSVTLRLFAQYLAGSVFRRAFVVPMQTGLWFCHYAQTVGHLGVAGIPKLAALIGVEPVNAANLVYLLYTSAPLQSGLANTSFVFAYYNYFGLASLPASIVLLWLLDSVLLVYRFISPRLLLAVVSTVSVACLSFVESEYTTALITHGFALIPLVSVLVDAAGQSRAGRGDPRTAYLAIWRASRVREGRALHNGAQST